MASASSIDGGHGKWGNGPPRAIKVHADSGTQGRRPVRPGRMQRLLQHLEWLPGHDKAPAFTKRRPLLHPTLTSTNRGDVTDHRGHATISSESRFVFLGWHILAGVFTSSCQSLKKHYNTTQSLQPSAEHLVGSPPPNSYVRRMRHTKPAPVPLVLHEQAREELAE